MSEGEGITTCRQVGYEGPTEWIDVELTDWPDLAGSYWLEVVATSGARPGTTSRGRLTLWVNDSTHQRHSVFHRIRDDLKMFFPFYGAVDSLFEWPTEIPVWVSPSSTDPDFPGFQFTLAGSSFRFVVGAPANPTISVSHTGVFADVDRITERAFFGRWQADDYVRGVDPNEIDWGPGLGYFCAWRL